MAVDPNRLAGTCFLSVDGRNYLLAADLTYSLSSVTRETLKGMDRVHGYSEAPNAGFIAASIRDDAGLSVADFNAMTNVNVTLELANGKTIVGRNMWTVEAQEVEAGEAKISVRWESVSVEEA